MVSRCRGVDESHVSLIIYIINLNWFYYSVFLPYICPVIIIPTIKPKPTAIFTDRNLVSPLKAYCATEPNVIDRNITVPKNSAKNIRTNSFLICNLFFNLPLISLFFKIKMDHNKMTGNVGSKKNDLKQAPFLTFLKITYHEKGIQILIRTDFGSFMLFYIIRNKNLTDLKYHFSFKNINHL